LILKDLNEGLSRASSTLVQAGQPSPQNPSKQQKANKEMQVVKIEVVRDPIQPESRVIVSIEQNLIEAFANRPATDAELLEAYHAAVEGIRPRTRP
jgi:hypothetical protein